MMTTPLNSEPNLIRYSGLRLAPERKAIALQAMAERVLEVGGPLIGGMINEAWCIDDALASLPPADIVKELLEDGELLLCYTPDNSNLVMLLGFHGVIVNRYAHMVAFASPEFRGQPIIQECGRQALDYAFKPAPGGLGLLKVKAEISEKNQACLVAADKLGFTATALLRHEGLFRGELCHMILGEIFNPQVFVPGEQINGRSDSQRQPIDIAPSEPGGSVSGGRVQPGVLGDTELPATSSVPAGPDPSAVAVNNSAVAERRANGRRRTASKLRPADGAEGN